LPIYHCLLQNLPILERPLLFEGSKRRSAMDQKRLALFFGMLKNYWKFLFASMLLLFLVSCEGTGSGSVSYEEGGDDGEGWVTIDEDSSYTTEYESTYLSGEAFISPTRGGCCTGSARDTGVTVTYTNADTGISGRARQRAEYCWFFRQYVCGHRWSESVALQMGENNITITATDGYNEGKDSVKVTRIPETTPPTVSSATPNSGADNVPVNTTINATFSEEMDASTINASSFILMDASGNPVGGWVTYSNKIATFKPYADLDYSTSHIATITAAVSDLSGNSMADDYTWSFNTGQAPDITPPTVITTIPASRAECVSNRILISATFDEDIDVSSINSSSFIVDDDSGNSVIGSVTYSDKIVTFTPLNYLEYSTTYISTITNAVKDISGNHMAADYTWDFTTSLPPEGFWESMSDPVFLVGGPGHTAIWTGTEMIVYGGTRTNGTPGGGKYNPVTDIWLPTAPYYTDKYSHTAVWTGTEMIIWGGDSLFIGGNWTSTGRRYDPSIDAWFPISSVNAPLSPSGHTAIWTGTEMIVWGGGTRPGGKYDPITDTWSPISAFQAPPALSGYTAVWTGTEMIVWHGNAVVGGKYDPVTDSWIPISSVNAPTQNSGHTAVWTGTEMIVWGWRSGTNTGGKYNPVTDTWQSVTSDCAPFGNYFTSVWTGSEMIVWGYVEPYDNGIGGIYNPVTDTWLELPYIYRPAASYGSTAIWTGREIIVWNGDVSGRIYKP
jgi:hypothetical protein